MMTSRTYHSLNLDIASFDSSSIIYILLPHRLPEEELSSIEELSTRFETNIVAISEMDWNNDLTPWKAPAVKEGEFGGHASQFLDRLKEDLFFNLEHSLKISKPTRYLIGLSLAGLFSVWAGVKKDLFDGVGAISGSFWYDGFTEWFSKHEHVYSDVFYFSLGEKEKDGKNARMAIVETATLEVVESLKSRGKEVIFEMTEGGHFSAIAPRLESAITTLLTQ